ncbi:hypothetical protein VNO78_10836 [Psophocarpus tetragonolobus]|uniref:Uncharacterized protein n=1 Tax=Psophocarpus tetragonolobus TaxID=3891 RepID=A0AAN9SS97_PSOTE
MARAFFVVFLSKKKSTDTNMPKRKTAKNKGKQVQVRDMDSSLLFTKQPESWGGPPSVKRGLIPDSTIIGARRARSRSASKLIGTRKTCVQVYQTSDSEFSVIHEETERSGDCVARENCSVDVTEMEEESGADHFQMEVHSNALEAECVSYGLGKR